ncbi:ComEA family DNA-binding protein [Gordonia rubripertincta]|uniref:ComEA family DNA-binding protein n=1 Tax=Gordonia rubripertincta TaxID=36822 RepID=A0ABT4MRB1_GORRU|nr:ComEA family DNA-binding protein [Gordonia rubripertincta]MCZ4548836.1 ComEA family DNA-binding protein [Gordonia rubripertincta]
MSSNLDRLAASEPEPLGPPQPSAPDAAVPAWLGSAQWLHDSPVDDSAAERRWSDESIDDPFDPGDPDSDGPLRRRWRSTPAAAIGLVIVGVLATLVALYTAFADGASGADVPVAFPETAGAATSSTASVQTADPPAELVISVVGLVHRPGLVRLPPQSRVADALEKAGGAKNGADLLSLNLAQPLRDGDQILVGFADPAGGPQMRSAVVAVDGAGGAPPPSAGATTGALPPAAAEQPRVDLNTATEAELDTLPGVGPVTAAAIIAWRNANGRFSSVDQLAEVDGIGPARLEKLRDRVTV